VVPKLNLFQQWNNRKYRSSRPLLRQVPLPGIGWRLPQPFSELGQNDLVHAERGHAPKSEEAIPTGAHFDAGGNFPHIDGSVAFAPAEPDAL
jgi:hypothetical protein